MLSALIMSALLSAQTQSTMTVTVRVLNTKQTVQQAQVTVKGNVRTVIY